MLATAARIARSVDVPVTVDAESGYGLEAGELVDALIGAGVAGCNLEDTDHRAGALTESGRQADRLRAIREAATKRRYPLVINARVDVFLADYGAGFEQHLDDGIDRARAYLEAGADCVYPIFLQDERAIGTFVEATGGPVNILAVSKAPPVSRLAELGVARVSYGSSIQQRVLKELAKILAEIRGR
jgi:2-methylisocitrate lyase-like PEP mutase family enzyme